MSHQPKASFSDERRYLTPKELAQYWPISERTLANWRWLGCGPAWAKIGGRVAYPIDAVLAYEKQNRVEGAEQ